MKITTNHTRTGIGVIHEQGNTKDTESVGKKHVYVHGILYDNPEQVRNAYKDETSDPVERQVSESGISARRMYKIFIADKIKLQKEEMYRSRVITYVSENLMKYVVMNIDNDKSKKSYIHYRTGMDICWNVKSQKKAFQKWMDEDVFKCLSYYNKKFDTDKVDALAEQMVDHAMRNSLRKMIRLPLNQYGSMFDNASRKAYSDYIVRAADKNGNLQKKSVDIWLPDVVKKMLHYVFQSFGKNGRNKPEKLLNIEQAALIYALDQDYWCVEKEKSIISSIKKQNVRVQIFHTKTGRPCLNLSNAENKKYIAKFITEYACADECGQLEMRNYIRRMILLYFCGEEAYEASFADENGGRLKQWDFEESCRYFSKTSLPGEPMEFMDLLKRKKFLKNQIKQKSEQKKLLYGEIRKQKDLEEKGQKKYGCKKNNLYNDLTDLKIQIQKHKEEQDDLILSIKNRKRRIVCDRYRACTGYLKSRKFPEGSYTMTDEEIEGWTGRIEEYAEKYLIKTNRLDERRLEDRKICSGAWKEWKAFVAVKYLDIGKAVYHFAMPKEPEFEQVKPDEPERDAEPVLFGVPLKEYKDGLTSFDYEYIKAHESMERDAVVYLTFAINNFARAVMDDKTRDAEKREDVLELKKEKDLKPAAFPDTNKRILRFFGGESRWIDVQELKEYADLENQGDVTLALAVRNELYMLRNANFHYTARTDDKETRKYAAMFHAMFKKEYFDLKYILCKKYYSNNTLVFYQKDDILRLIMHLYGVQGNMPTQAPKFRHIVNDATLMDFMRETGINLETIHRFDDAHYNEIKMPLYHASIRFIFQEIYYNDFLKQTEKDLLAQFEHVLNEYKKECFKKKEQNKKDKDAQKEYYAVNDFSEYVERLRVSARKNNTPCGFGDICKLMTMEYSIQNKNRKVLLSEEEGEEKYKHFKMVLYHCIRQMLISYIKGCAVGSGGNGRQDVYKFLKYPAVNTEICDEESFYPSDRWEPGAFSHVKKLMDADSGMESLNYVYRAWYVVAHFLNPKQLNLLAGSIRSNARYMEDSICRAEMTGNQRESHKAVMEKEMELYEGIVSVLSFCSLFCGKVSNKISDYYDADGSGFDENICQYVDIGNSGSLLQFCRQSGGEGSPNPQNAIGIYCDAENKILNRNLVSADLYGNARIVSRCLASIKDGKVNKKDILEYYDTRKKLLDNGILKSGVCQNEEQRRLLSGYQEMKNRIELVDVLRYSEMINDLISQLISWVYLRERDLMYFQIGFHYLKLGYTTDTDNEYYRKFGELKGNLLKKKKERVTKTGKFLHLEGALLYQIAAMYTYRFPIYSLYDQDNNGIWQRIANKQTSEGIRKFAAEYGNDIYDAGMELFQKCKEEEDIISFRNSIDHFHYQARAHRSILDLYSEMYDRFFDYDTKLRKNVPVVFQNILLRNYFVIAELTMEKERKVSDAAVKGQHGRQRVFAKFSIANVKSEKFTYKIDYSKEKESKQQGDGKQTKVQPVNILVHNEVFLEKLQAILEYNE